MRDSNAADPPAPGLAIPPQVQNLPQRERELAIIVYLSGPMTAKALETQLSRSLSNSAIRSMLSRLCRKRILKRRKITGSHHSTDRRIPYLYSPAITAQAVRKRALVQLANDYFEGSLPRVAQALTEVLNEISPAKPTAKGIDIAA